MEWSQVVAKALDQAKVFVPAGGLTGLVLLFAPPEWGLLTTTGDIVWIPVITIFLLISTAMMVLLSNYVAAFRLLADQSARPARRRQATKKFSVLSKDQHEYLAYIKLKHRDRQFQAWIHDDVIDALERMHIIEGHELTGRNYQRFTIPLIIWRKIPEPLEEHAAALNRKYATSPPWSPDRHSGRIL